MGSEARQAAAFERADSVDALRVFRAPASIRGALVHIDTAFDADGKLLRVVAGPASAVVIFEAGNALAASVETAFLLAGHDGHAQ